MLRLPGDQALPSSCRGGIVALGNFDGFHLGHQAVVGAAVAQARREGRPALVAIFDPHPRRFFAPAAPPFDLTSVEQRQALFEATGVDATIVYHFDRQFADRTARDFIERHLVAGLGIAGVVTGRNFSFGKGRTGDIATLARLGDELGFSALAVDSVELDGTPVSSTRIRRALQAGDPARAARLMTRPFVLRARIGRRMGAGARAIHTEGYQPPASGLYDVRCRMPGGGVAYATLAVGGAGAHAIHDWPGVEAGVCEIELLARRCDGDAIPRAAE